MAKIYRFVVIEDHVNERLDQFLEKQLLLHNEEVSRSFIQQFFDHVLVNDQKKKKNYRVKNRDQIQFTFPKLPKIDLIPEEIDFETIYEDKYLIVVNKPAGLVVHPAKGHYSGTLVHGLLNRLTEFDDIEDNERPGIVHRLDKDTSGLLVVAKSLLVQRKLTRLFQDRKISKNYVALVKGKLPLSGRVNDPIQRHPVYRKKYRVHHSGKEALTKYKTEKIFELKDRGHFQYYSLADINLITGRTHQIRVHFSAIGHPVVGDIIYSKPKNDFEKKGLALCSKKLSFAHPITDKVMTFECELPPHFQTMLNEIKENCTI